MNILFEDAAGQKIQNNLLVILVWNIIEFFRTSFRGGAPYHLTIAARSFSFKSLDNLQNSASASFYCGIWLLLMWTVEHHKVTSTFRLQCPSPRAYFSLNLATAKSSFHS